MNCNLHWDITLVIEKLNCIQLLIQVLFNLFRYLFLDIMYDRQHYIIWFKHKCDKIVESYLYTAGTNEITYSKNSNSQIRKQIINRFPAISSISNILVLPITYIQFLMCQVSYNKYIGFQYTLYVLIQIPTTLYYIAGNWSAD